MKDFIRNNESMTGRTLPDRVRVARQTLDETPVGDTFLLIQNLQALFTLQAMEHELRYQGGR